LLRTQNDNGLIYYRFHNLTGAGIPHGIFTRLGGRSLLPFSSLNVGHTVGDDPEAVDSNHKLIYHSFGCDASVVVSARQVHGDGVSTVKRGDEGKVFQATDALLTNEGGITLMLRFADCIPILLAEPDHPMVGIVHAGWRGTLGRIAQKAVEEAVCELGIDPVRLIAGIGPSIGPCCYEVGPEVLQQFKAHSDAWSSFVIEREGRCFLDLWEANRSHLLRAGVRDVETARLCTACHVDEFFSHRRERGLTGRFGALVST
jgi:YfiH family protein